MSSLGWLGSSGIVHICEKSTLGLFSKSAVLVDKELVDPLCGCAEIYRQLASVTAGLHAVGRFLGKQDLPSGQNRCDECQEIAVSLIFRQ